jgi:hypothetical protein
LHEKKLLVIHLINIYRHLFYVNILGAAVLMRLRPSLWSGRIVYEWTKKLTAGELGGFVVSDR